MKLNYTLLDPTGNITVLVTTPVPPSHQPSVGARLLAAEPSAEQVGFLSPGVDGCQLSLRMAGGEFCGNAAMSAAAWWCETNGMPARAKVRLAVSGAQDPVEAEMQSLPGLWQGTVTMPPAGEPQLLTLPLEGQEITLPVVDMGGIRHAILTQKLDKATAEPAVRRWCALLDAPALGRMLLEEETGTLTPLVYVPSADTLYWERSCASGSTAVGSYLARKRGSNVTVALKQPGGTLEVSASPDGHARLTGHVTVLRSAAPELPDGLF